MGLELPITRTVSGLVYEWNLDSLEDGAGYPSAQWAVDLSDKEEGSASIKWDSQFSFFAYFCLTSAAAAEPSNRIHIWHKATGTSHTWQLKVECIGMPSCPQGSLPYYTTTVITKSGNEGWTLKKGTIPSNFSEGGNRWIYPSVLTANNYDVFTDSIDHCVVSTTQYLTITGLTPGQLVELYRASDDTKITEGTCAGGATQVILDIDDEDYPEYMHLKVYATDGVTLVEKTANQRICGGDTWQWNAPLGTMDIKSATYTIYRTGTAGTPTSSLVTATLRTPAGAPYANATVYFVASKGTLSVASDVTDASGEARTSLSSSVHGIAVVSAYWPGDASVPAAIAYAPHHVLYDLEVGDANKKFQLFIEGIPYAYSTGSYGLSNDNTPQEFSVEIPEWVSTITRRGLVSIFRKGVKEYSGVLTVIDDSLADPPRVLLSGVNSESLLETRTVTLKDYSAQTVAYIANNLLTSFWCGIGLGSVSDYPGTLSQPFSDESLASSVARLVDIIGWQYRMTPENKLDIKPSFGTSKPLISFVQGVNLFINRYRIDDRKVCNSLRMRGSEDLVSTVFDGVSIMEDDLGLLEDVMFQKSIGAQTTLDIAANAELARRAGQNISIQAEVKDDYAAGTWGVDDSITLTVPDHDLSGVYNVVKIERDMTDPNWARVDFLTKLDLEWGDLWQSLRRELKDLGAKTTI
jgi:hypothetical protein